jgi:hypothetical protein
LFENKTKRSFKIQIIEDEDNHQFDREIKLGPNRRRPIPLDL